MDGCCPSPEYPIVQPDEQGLKHRKILLILYYGQALLVFMKLLCFGTMSGLLQLINLWIIYTAYATLHFCSSLIYLILCCFDLLFITMDWAALKQLAD